MVQVTERQKIIHRFSKTSRKKKYVFISTVFPNNNDLFSAVHTCTIARTRLALSEMLTKLLSDHRTKIGSDCANLEIGTRCSDFENRHICSHTRSTHRSMLEAIILLDNRKSISCVLRLSNDNRKTFVQQV